MGRGLRPDRPGRTPAPAVLPAGASRRARADWEPPVDVFEDEREIVIVVAMPGVSAERVQVMQRAGRAGGARRAAAAARRLAPSRAPARDSLRRVRAAHSAAAGPLEVGTPELAHGCLLLRLRKIDGDADERSTHADRSRPAPAEGADAGRGRCRRRHAQPEAAARPLPDDALIILPVRNVVMFPGMVFPLTVGRERSRAAVQEAVRLERPIGVLLQSKPEVDEPAPGRPALGRHQRRRAALHDHARRRASCGRRRACAASACCSSSKAIRSWSRACSYIDEPAQADPEIEGRARALKQRALETLQLLPQVPAEMVAALQGVGGRGAARRLHRRPDGHPAPRRSSRCSRPST